MNKEQRIRRLKAMVGAQKIVKTAADRYIIEIPGYSLRTTERADSPYDAINQAVQYFARTDPNQNFKPSEITEDLRVRVTKWDRDPAARTTQELAVPVQQAMSGSTSYPLPDFGGYDEEPAELGPNITEHEQGTRPLSPEEQAHREAVGEEVEEMVLNEPNFSEPKVFMTDPTGQFQPSDINQLLFRASNKNWITIPDEARRKGINTLYYTTSPTEYDKYFGLKTEYGYVHTFASALLQHAAKRANAPRGDLSGVKKLKIPEDYPLHGQVGEYIITLPIQIETALIREAYRILGDANRKPSNLRKLKYNRDGSITYTTSFTNTNIRQTEPMGQFTPEMEQRLKVMDRGLSKPIADYRRLNQMVEKFISELDGKMGLLLKEQHGVNASSRFLKPSGKREDVDDVLKQVILRKIIGAIQGSEVFNTDEGELTSPLEGTEMQEMDYDMPN